MIPVEIGFSHVKEEDLDVVQCPEAGTASQGDSIAEAIKKLAKATELY